MSYTTAAAAINTDTVRQRIRVAIVAFSLTVMAEVNTVPGHANRVGLATKILGNPDAYAPLFSVAVIAFNQLAASDADIDAGIAATFNALAGVAN